MTKTISFMPFRVRVPDGLVHRVKSDRFYVVDMTACGQQLLSSYNPSQGRFSEQVYLTHGATTCLLCAALPDTITVDD